MQTTGRKIMTKLTLIERASRLKELSEKILEAANVINVKSELTKKQREFFALNVSNKVFGFDIFDHFNGVINELEVEGFGDFSDCARKEGIEVVAIFNDATKAYVAGSPRAVKFEFFDYDVDSNDKVHKALRVNFTINGKTLETTAITCEGEESSHNSNSAKLNGDTLDPSLGKHFNDVFLEILEESHNIEFPFINIPTAREIEVAEKVISDNAELLASIN